MFFKHNFPLISILHWTPPPKLKSEFFLSFTWFTLNPCYLKPASWSLCVMIPTNLNLPCTRRLVQKILSQAHWFMRIRIKHLGLLIFILSELRYLPSWAFIWTNLENLSLKDLLCQVCFIIFQWQNGSWEDEMWRGNDNNRQVLIRPLP